MKFEYDDAMFEFQTKPMDNHDLRKADISRVTFLHLFTLECGLNSILSKCCLAYLLVSLTITSIKQSSFVALDCEKNNLRLQLL